MREDEFKGIATTHEHHLSHYFTHSDAGLQTDLKSKENTQKPKLTFVFLHVRVVQFNLIHKYVCAPLSTVYPQYHCAVPLYALCYSTSETTTFNQIWGTWPCVCSCLLVSYLDFESEYFIRLKAQGAVL